MNFQKFMLCNDKSPIKLEEAHLMNGGFREYPCFEDIMSMFDNCGGDLMEPLFEMYRVRIRSGQLKPPAYTRLQTFPDKYNDISDGKVLHF